MEKTDVLFRRFWLLTVLGGLERAGMCPVEFRSFNSVLYLINTISSTYRVQPLISTVVKEASGPLYADLTWDIDRLVGMCLCSVHDLKFDSNRQGRFVKYGITEQGIDLINVAVAEIPILEKIKEAIFSISLAYGRNPASGLEDNLLLLDANYATNKYQLRDVIDFGVWEDFNATEYSIDYISQCVASRMMRQPPSHVAVNLYTEYLSGGAYART